MKKAKVWLPIVGIVLVIAIVWLVFYNAPPIPKDGLFLGDEDTYFGMTRRALVNTKGEPTEFEENIYEDVGLPTDQYVYTEKIGGYDAKCSYYLVKSVFGVRLTEVSVSIEDIDYDAALALTEELMDKQEPHYSQYNGYYRSDAKQEGDTEFTAETGMNLGAIGVSFVYTYSSGKLHISGFDQE